MTNDIVSEHTIKVPVKWDGQKLYAGKVKVAEYFFDGLRSRDEPKKYQVRSPLPTIKNYLGNFETKEECKAKCEKALQVFLNQLQTIMN